MGVALLKHLVKEGHACTVYSRDEVKQGELRGQFPDVNFVLGDVRDAAWLEVAMRKHDYVVHAAAYKQVPAAEVNAGEAIETNVIGSRNVARAAVKNNIHRVVGISTDKACAPINCYGETKALMEKLFQQAGGWGDTIFTLVRYGNVLGSRGSVLPLFRKQIRDGCVTFTDRKMTRFWLTLADAVGLVATALTTPSGTVLVPKAPASTMEALLDAILASMTWGALDSETTATVETKDIGIRPGEKIHECMVHKGEAIHTSSRETSFLIYPAFANYCGNLPCGFEYTSDRAKQLTKQELVEMLRAA